MICANCRKERVKGSYYGFHYGLVHKDADEAEKVETGSDQVWICRICVNRRILLTWIVGGILLLGLFLRLQGDYLVSQIQFFISPRVRDVFGVEIGIPLSRFVYDAIPVIMILWAITGIFGAYLLWQGIKEFGKVGARIATKVARGQYSPGELISNNRQSQKVDLTGETDMTEYINTADFEDLLSKKDVDRLIEVLERGGTRALQMEAADALGKLGDAKAIEPLVKLINNRYWAIQVRISSVKAVGRIGGEEGRKALEELATFEDMHGWTDEVEAIRDTAKTTLKFIE